MTGQDELAQLEAERDRLLSMMAYHNRQVFQVPFQVPGPPVWTWFVAAAVICGIGVSIVAGVFARQIAAIFIFLLVGLPLLAYIKVKVFGIRISLLEIMTLTPPSESAGEPETRQRLADCEARIMKLKEGRP
jgi:hypothetical protein